MKNFNFIALFFILLLSPFFSQASTVDNIKLLNKYAEELFAPGGSMQKEVDDRFTKMGLNPTLVPKLFERYKIYIPEDTDCFWENSVRIFSDFDIYGPSDFAIMKRQFLAAANFLKEVHVSTGVAVSTKDIVTSFATIIVPNSKIVESLSFQDVFEKMKKLKRQKAAKALGFPPLKPSP